MPRNITITFADGSQHVYKNAPDDITPDAVQARAQQEFNKPIAKLDGGRRPTFGERLKDEVLTSLPGGFVRGVKDVIDTGAELLATGYDKLTGGDQHNLSSLVTGQRPGEGARVKAMNEAGKAEFAAAQERAGAGGSDVARVAGNIVGTLPVGGVLGAGAKAIGATRLGNALATGGFRTGAPAGANMLTKTADMGIRMAGGAGTGYASAGLIDPESAATGGVVGTLLPPFAKIAGAGGNALANMLRPFTSGGQERIAANALREFSTNPEAARNLANAREVVPGSMPTAVAAAGDEGLAGLSRTLQSTSPQYAAELSTRAASQNAARTAALEEIAGNTGKLSIARQARDVATDPMREAVLDAAGNLTARPVLASIDRLMAVPGNAGKQAQAALGEVRNRIAQFSPDGRIDARALYAIRKDIGDMLGGKLQGEAGNLKLASGQLIEVKGIIDEAIDQASRSVNPSASRALMPAGANMERAGQAGAYGSQAPRASWKQYLQTYSDHSIPIDQMERLEKVLTAVGTGAVDKSGNAVLSAAKLNNYLRTNAKELAKELAPEQLAILRNVAADLNATQLATNAGKAVGSNTVQNLAGTNALSALVGNRLANSTFGQSALNRLLQLPYGASNKMIQEKLGAALLDPKEAARLLKEPGGNKLLEMLSDKGAAIGYRSAPAISANP